MGMMYAMLRFPMKMVYKAELPSQHHLSVNCGVGRK